MAHTDADAIAIAIVFVCKVHKCNLFVELKILTYTTEKHPQREKELYCVFVNVRLSQKHTKNC